MTGYSKKVIAVYIIGVLGFFALRNTPISIPCIFRLIFGIPCPACGLTRAFILISQLRFVDAMRMNILSVPLFLGGIVYFVCAVSETFTGKEVLRGFNIMLARCWVIAFAAVLVGVSWWYNLAQT